MKILRVGDDFIHAERLAENGTEKYEEANNSFKQFCDSV